MGELQVVLTELERAERPRLAFLHRALCGVREAGQRLGVFSGSFNPPTIAHVRMCEIAQTRLELQEVLLLLAIVNVDKRQFDFALEERVAMMRAIAQKRLSWSAALCSHGRFVEKVQAVAEAYPKGTEVWFVVGYDTLVRLFEPRFYPDLPRMEALACFFRLARLAVFPRADHSEATVHNFLQRPEAAPFADRITVLPTEPSLQWVSSTLVRQKWREGEPISELVPPEVAAFLQEFNRGG